MAVIEQVLTMVDVAVSEVVGMTYIPIMQAVQPVVAVSSALVIALVGVNLVTQTTSLTYANALSLGLRIVLVNIFIGMVNVMEVYYRLTNAPGEIGAGLLTAISDGTVGDLNTGLDGLYSQALNLGEAIAQNGGWLAGAITSVVLFLVAATMATITIIVMAATKIMLAVLLAIAPAVIACTLFKQTAPIFEAWVKLALGFALVPLLVAAMAGFTIMTANEVAPRELFSSETLGDAVSFIVVMMLGTGLLLQVPTIAQSLAGTGIGLGAIAANAQGAPGRSFRSATGAVRTTADAVAGAKAGWEAAKTGNPTKGVHMGPSNAARGAAASAALAHRMFARQNVTNAAAQAKMEAAAKSAPKGPAK